MEVRPPKYPLRFLRWFCREEYLEEIEGDLYEVFEKRHMDSPAKAKRLFVWDVIRTFRPINVKKLKINHRNMNSLQNYTKVYFRRVRKETSHFLVNTIGLGLGFTVFFFILIYIHDERHIDSHHSKADRIYRVIEKQTSEDGQVHFYSASANPLAWALKADFEEIEEAAQMIYFGSAALRYGDHAFPDRNYAYASHTIFKVLDFEILAGDPLKEFNGPMGLVLSEDNARKLFGEEDPIGKLVELPNRELSVEVLAVMKNMPKNSTYQFNMIFVSDFEEFGKKWPQYFGDYLTSWDTRGMVTFALFRENSDPASVLDRKENFMKKYYPEEIRSQHDFDFQPITAMHLGSNFLDEYSTEPLRTIPYSNHKFVSILLIIGVLVMMIAGFNYINLSSVMAIKRTLEAGIRKINGATPGQLRMQVFYETFLTLSIAYVVAIVLMFISFPNYSAVVNKDIPFDRLFRWDLLGYQLMTLMVIWLISSAVPAVYYSRLSRSLGSIKSYLLKKGDLFRKSLVTIQYSISLLLIIGSLVFYRQMSFIETKNLGFDKENIITLDINSDQARDNQENIINTLKQHPDVINASVSSRVPGEWKSIADAGVSRDQKKDPVTAIHYAADRYWFDTYGMELKEGANFSGSPGSDTLKIILNERAVVALGLDNPVGESLWVFEDTVTRMQIIGVVKDFHFESLQKNIAPVIITSLNNPISGMDYFSVKYRGNVSEVVGHIEDVQRQFDPETPAELNFLDSKWDRYYQADHSRSRIILIATVISIIISVFGLFGLINFTIERKTKEIGIRKVLGATIRSIIQIVLKDYALLLIISLVLAAPPAYWILSGWLEDYAYRIDLSVDIFVLAFLTVVTISFLTVIFRVNRFARSNPVNSLRNE